MQLSQFFLASTSRNAFFHLTLTMTLFVSAAPSTAVVVFDRGSDDGGRGGGRRRVVVQCLHRIGSQQ